MPNTSSTPSILPVEWDNRDIDETWLWIARDEFNEKIEVSPFELYKNALENLPKELSSKYVPLFEQFHKDVIKALNKEYSNDSNS